MLRDRYAWAQLRYIFENPLKARVTGKATDCGSSGTRALPGRAGPGETGRGSFAFDVSGRRTASRAPAADAAVGGRAVRRGGLGSGGQGDETFSDRVLQEARESPVQPRGLTMEEQVARLDDLDLGRLRGRRHDARLSK
jgi:hypothetical protein